MKYPNLSVVVKGFLLHVDASGRSSNTHRIYEHELIRFQSVINDVPIDQVTNGHFEKYMAYLSTNFFITRQGKTPIPPRKLSQKSLSTARAILAVFAKWYSTEFELTCPFVCLMVLVRQLLYLGRLVSVRIIRCNDIRTSGIAPL